MFDIDALNFAVPYCDIVVTEKHRSHVLNTAKLPERTATTVVATLDELTRLLAPRTEISLAGAAPPTARGSCLSRSAAGTARSGRVVAPLIGERREP